MDTDRFTALIRQFLGREPNPAELIAMAGQAERTAQLIAAHPAGRSNALFTVEPAGWDALMAGEATS